MDLIQFLPSFGNLAFTLIAFIVAISIIVAVHEYGHYIVGRWSGIDAEVFSLGFGPVLFSRVDRRGTRWQFAALPFGGYVKFLGDANPASVGGARGGARNTMLGAPLWARAATVAAGPVFNFLFSFLIFAALLMSAGRPTVPMTVAEIRALPERYEVGLQPGDEILAVGGVELEDGLLPEDLPHSEVLDYRVRRDGAETVVEAPYPVLPILASITPNSAAMDAGLRSGDIVTAIDGREIWSFQQIYDAVVASEGRTLDLAIWRDGETFDVSVAPRRADLPLPEGGFETRWLLGATSDLFFTPATESPSLLQALWGGVAQVWFIITSSLSGLWHVVTGAISTCNLSGPVGIAETSGAMASQGTVSFLWFLAVISTAVGFLNLFPIPVLDGGHLMFHLWEGITGRMPSDGALRVLMAAGLAVVLTLMVFALANDLFLCP
ncbi:RIP metalloprotease RseP [Wenxinia marina]|uniref:Zinc metalloprotease n=1 Tax=Wenxinia marina DSM 24838 TaxID=1123501 RepID=A0A0D0Q5F6_9RHOB|nr:RIP metalloprotease RseP [Wenxinia marina]KIQ67722.1 RIP metalloprotease RseP [Wenxinia marina DSM 24838]GGL77691.1 zinc metalloprotease [Wenxinia marina]